MSRIVLLVDGGIVQDVLTDDPDVEVVLVDYDIEGFDRTQQVPGFEGGHDEAFIKQALTTYDPRWVEGFFRVAKNPQSFHPNDDDES